MTRRCTAHLVSVTEVRMSPDLRHATVFVKPLLGQDEEVVLKALRTNTAFFQREVAQPGAHQICRQAQVPRRRKLRRRQPDRPPAALRPRSRRTSTRNDRRPRRADDRRRLPRRAVRPKQHRDALRAACAEDRDIWQIYYDQLRARAFRRQLRRAARAARESHLRRCSTATSSPACRALPRHRRRPADARDRRHLLPPALPRHRLQPPRQGHDAAPRLRLRHPPRRVPRRRPQRAQPGGDDEARRGPRRRAARRPHHLDRPCPRHRAVLDPQGRMAACSKPS